MSHIRPAKADDAEGIAQVARDSYLHLPARHVPADMRLYHAEFQREAMQDDATRWAVLCEQGQPRGFAMWRMIPGMSHLHMLFVSGDHQGKGYGSALLHYHQQEVVREQLDTRLFTLHCLRDSHWAMRFYKHQGYTLYEPGDEGRITNLYLWIDYRRSQNSWPLGPEKVLFYKLVKG